MFNPWPFFALISMCMLLISHKRLFRFLDSAPTGGGQRSETLDGLRGFLALAVFVHHATVTYGYVKTGVWQIPPSRFYTLLGQVGVSLFFMITGYLFWSKLLSGRNRIDWVSLYIGRFFRIAPLYLFVILAMFILVFHRTGGILHQPASDVTLQIIRWLGFGLFDQSEVNGYNAPLILAGVTWTIYYEWLFYFSLPALAVIAASRSHLALVITGIWIIFKIPTVFVEPDRYFIGFFLCGMCSASLHHKLPTFSLKSPIFSILGFLLIAEVFLNYDTAYTWRVVTLLGCFFFIVTSNASLFGLLTLRASKRLGNISYSIYLLHGLILTTIFSPQAFGRYATIGPWQFWTVVLFAAALLILLSATTFLIVERPGIALGKRIRPAVTRWISDGSREVIAEHV